MICIYSIVQVDNNNVSFIVINISGYNIQTISTPRLPHDISSYYREYIEDI